MKIQNLLCIALALLTCVTARSTEFKVRSFSLPETYTKDTDFLTPREITHEGKIIKFAGYTLCGTILENEANMYSGNSHFQKSETTVLPNGGTCVLSIKEDDPTNPYSMLDVEMQISGPGKMKVKATVSIIPGGGILFAYFPKNSTDSPELFAVQIYK